MKTIDDRKRMQKLVYLFPNFGIDLKFRYNWYIHGPYSPDLADILFDIVQGEPVSPEHLSDKELSRARRLAEFLGDDVSSPDRLELLASIAFLADQVGGLSQGAENEIISFLKKTKPYFTEDEIQQAIQRARRLKPHDS
jgi:hypothetical protein